MKAVAKRRTAKQNKPILLGKKSAGEILDGLKVTPAERGLARTVVDKVMKRRSAAAK